MRRTIEMFARSTPRCDSSGNRANSIVAVRNAGVVLPTRGAVGSSPAGNRCCCAFAGSGRVRWPRRRRDISR
ncbi:hypothetical protein CA830_21300 [Burkholderia multivorans]|nr:hypothetical protein CA830_21300 [Burkholderia multivorans]OXH90046.1 hypothetical protein CA831_11715 [Burkholderia multivorans]